MQKKFGSIISADIFMKARQYCQTTETTMSQLLEKALISYLNNNQTHSSPLSTVDSSFGVFKLSSKHLKEILEEDIYES